MGLLAAGQQGAAVADQLLVALPWAVLAARLGAGQEAGQEAPASAA